MEKNIADYAVLELIISLWVEAPCRQRARETAEHMLNGGNARLQSVVMSDKEGMRHRLRVRKVKGVDWLCAEHGEISNRFRVNGKLELILTGYPGERVPPRWSVLRLDRSKLSALPVLEIPTWGDVLMVQVRRQLLKWVPEPLEQERRVPVLR